jgi:hypothetical protein
MTYPTGMTPLHAAAGLGSWICIDALLNGGASLELRDRFSATFTGEYAHNRGSNRRRSQCQRRELLGRDGDLPCNLTTLARGG